MRGEHTDKDIRADARKTLHDAAEQAKLVLAEAEVVAKKKRSVSTAIIIGPDGEPLFHIVSTWWSRILLMGYGVMLALIILLALLLYSNKIQLSTLEEKVDSGTNVEQEDPEAEK